MVLPERGRARPPVMTDVAQLAGVSHQTVSRVLNDHPNVRPQTREIVLAAITELGYRPNAAARTLVTRRTHTLGVISFDTTLYGPASMLYGIERAARDSYFVAIASVPTLDRRSVLDAVDRFTGQAVEGIIVIAPQISAVEALSYCQADIPLVAVGCRTSPLVAVGCRTSPPVASVAVDNFGGAALATRYLLGLGHRCVHHLSGPASWLDAQARVEGWRQALREAGVAAPDPLAGDWSSASGYELGHQIARDDSVTAVLCANDHMALGLIRALSEHGRRVPDDVSVVGFDDIPEAGYFLPPLTTVRQDFGELGRRALDTLVGLIFGQTAAGSAEPVAPQFTVRSSTRPPRN
ncbi:MAG TPA: LacI family DNA-binding transcriptional regulator [Streptosporangiaceae bacterium]|nr:LacI family DNA-binding transcriptional regulator [Streptosporangiaceae bacterium]